MNSIALHSQKLGRIDILPLLYSDVVEARHSELYLTFKLCEGEGLALDPNNDLQMLSVSSLIRCLTLGCVPRLQTLHITNGSSKKEPRNSSIFLLLYKLYL